MNISTSAPNIKKFSSPNASTAVTLGDSSKSWGKTAVDTVAANPYRSITDVVTLTSAIGNLAAANNSPTGTVFQVASIALTFGHGISALIHGVSAPDAWSAKDQKRLGVTAVGELLTCAGHGAQLAGAGALGLGLVAFGAAVTTFSDFSHS
jgi:hypothetical protein